MPVRLSNSNDYPDWLKLAKEVEPLFGPMVDDPNFCDGLRTAIREGHAICFVEGGKSGGSEALLGGILISKAANEILWLAVAERSRGRKIGSALLAEALGRLDRTRPITVTTFERSLAAGIPARRLYESVGFHYTGEAGLNPAGIPTVVMTLA
ncbi:MAG: GNAT family N-acetyltransferase [Desulfobacterales bacterium]|nr:GNAT family N-acetyltransferase [Desulfobacterales bacterium]